MCAWLASWREQVWESFGNGFMRFSALDSGMTELGYIVENRVLQSTLNDHLSDLQGRLE
jgi:2-polyprenyl-6-methoxyphenol hydroxylase-like FAD-dependent oxidoreductase